MAMEKQKKPKNKRFFIDSFWTNRMSNLLCFTSSAVCSPSLNRQREQDTQTEKRAGDAFFLLLQPTTSKTHTMKRFWNKNDAKPNVHNHEIIKNRPIGSKMKAKAKRTDQLSNEWKKMRTILPQSRGCSRSACPILQPSPPYKQQNRI